MRILVFGDSIAYGAWDSQGGWADRLKRYVHQKYVNTNGETKIQLINLGIGGDTSTKILARLKAETDARYSANWPDVFVFSFGTNDARTTDGVADTEFETFCSNSQKIIETAQQYSEKIMFVGVPSTQDQSLDFKGTVFEDQRIKQYEDALRQIAQGANVPYVEVRGAFSESRSSLYAIDRLHPNDAGHELIATIVKPELEKLLATDL